MAKSREDYTKCSFVKCPDCKAPLKLEGYSKPLGSKNKYAVYSCALCGWRGINP